MRIDGGWKQLAVGHLEDAHEEKHLVLPDTMQPAFQLGHRAPRNIPSCHLQLGREFPLRPIPIHPQLANLRPDDVVD